MPDHEGKGETENVERFHYFMVRLSRLDADPKHFSGLIERLGSGEKRTFDDQDGLVHLFTTWSIYAPNMPPSQTDHNSPESK